MYIICMGNPIIDEKSIELFTVKLYSLEMIAKTYNVSRMAVKKYLNKHGVMTAKKKFKVDCFICGKPVIKPRNIVRSNDRCYCSRDCYYKARENIDFISDRNGLRIARNAVSKYFKIPHGAVIHHIDSNESNNDIKNLWVFKNNADHLRFHHNPSNAKPIWTIYYNK